MSLLILGINHKTAPLVLREKLAFAPNELPAQLQHLQQITAAEEIAILSTCNRTEFYGQGIAIQILKRWIVDHTRLTMQELDPCFYVHQHEQAIRHALAVASGLDSMIIGEPQIFGQMKDACAIAREARTLGPLLDRCFQFIFARTKDIRTRTHIGAHPVSLAKIGVTLAQDLFHDLSQKKALFIGAGDMIESMINPLQEAGVSKFYLANRESPRAQALAQRADVQLIALDGIQTILNEVDMIIAATQSTTPILCSEQLESTLSKREGRPLFILDLAVPRDIDPEIGHLPGVKLYNIDDLQMRAQNSLDHRKAAAVEAQELIDEHVNDYMRTLRSFDSLDLIRHYRQKVGELRDEELAKALQKLEQGQSPALVLEQFAHAFSQKLMHQPCMTVRQASERGEPLDQAAKLLGISAV